MGEFESISFNINFSANMCSLVISIILLISMLFGGNLNKKIYRWFFLTVFLNLIGTVSDIILGYLIYFTDQPVNTYFYALDNISMIIPGLQGFTLTMHLYELIKERAYISKKVIYILIALCLSHIVLITIIIISNRFVLYEGYLYQPYDLYWAWLIFPALIMLVYTTIIIKYIKVLKPKEWISFLIYCVSGMIFSILETYYSNIWFGYFSASITMFLVYLNIQVELKWELQEKKAELTENRIAIMLSQIQPHFLYNSLNAISDLYYDNREANEALLSFASYLRANMDSLTENTLIPFEKELEHVNNYLELEKLRFKNRLNIEWDLQTVDFMLPSLILQPIVENAVRYGVTKRREGGTIKIYTEETKNTFLIKVIDDGFGFDQEEPLDKERSHIGLSNVSERLFAMCRGSLEIESVLNKGTCVTIEIPKERR